MVLTFPGCAHIWQCAVNMYNESSSGRVGSSEEPYPAISDRHGLHRCCHVTVDFGTAASQNGYSVYKLSMYKKTNIIYKRTKIIVFYYFHPLSKSSRETRPFLVTFVELRKHRFVMQPLQNPPLCSSTTASNSLSYWLSL
jgi:hypothetical protein